MDPEPQYDSYAPMDERYLQNIGQHRREGTHDLEIEKYERCRNEVKIIFQNHKYNVI